MREVLLALGCLAVMLIYLLVEAILLGHRRRSIPLRIAVTGTRGKSTVVRLIAAVMREAGHPVIAKATGSQPVLIFPDGEEERIHRKGMPTIREGTKLIRRGAEIGARALVAEMMSIQPESIWVESVRILQPSVLVLTNVHVDHVNEMGSTRESAARCLATAVSRNMTVFVPEEECLPLLEQTVIQRGATLLRVPPGSPPLPRFELEENVRLALAVADFLEIDRDVAVRAMGGARPDLGAAKVWQADIGSPARRWRLVSLFAANDPASCRKVISRFQDEEILPKQNITGLLILRRDRGDRSLQWLHAMQAGTFPEISRLYVVGDHARFIEARLRHQIEFSTHVVLMRDPAKIMGEISAAARESTTLIGMGNMVGIGEKMVAYWTGIGESP